MPLSLALSLSLSLSPSPSLSLPPSPLLYRATASLHRSAGRGRVGRGGPLQTRSGRGRRRAAVRRPRGAARPHARAAAPASGRAVSRWSHWVATRGAPRGAPRGGGHGGGKWLQGRVRRRLRGGGRGLEGGAGCAREEEEQRRHAGVGHWSHCCRLPRQLQGLPHEDIHFISLFCRRAAGRQASSAGRGARGRWRQGRWLQGQWPG